MLRSISRRQVSLAAMGGTLLGTLGPRQGRAAQDGPAKGLDKLAVAPRELPAFSFTDAEGAAKDVAAFKGKGLVVNLWATWCAPCVAEMPALDRMQAALAGDGLVVLALSSDRGGRTMVEPFYTRTGVKQLGLWLDPRGAAARALGARGLPTSVLINRAGEEVARLEGEAAWDHPAWLAKLRQLVLA